MQNQKLQLFDSLKALLLVDTKYSERLNPVTIERGRMSNERHSQLKPNNAAPHFHDDDIAHEDSMGGPSGKNTSVHHARNFLVNAVAISICMIALILSMDALPIIFKLIAFCGSLMVGFIIEFMLNGDEYE